MNRDDLGKILIVAAVLLLLLAFLFERNGGEKKLSSMGSPQHLNGSRSWNESIDQKMKDALTKRELNQMQTEVDSTTAESLDINSSASSSIEVIPFALDQENPGRRVLNDTVKNKNPTRPLTPDQRISSKVEKEQWADEDLRRRQAEYVRQFIQNAKERGVNIRLNKNLDVTGISSTSTDEPIRIPQAEGQGAK